MCIVGQVDMNTKFLANYIVLRFYSAGCDGLTALIICKLISEAYVYSNRNNGSRDVNELLGICCLKITPCNGKGYMYSISGYGKRCKGRIEID